MTNRFIKKLFKPRLKAGMQTMDALVGIALLGIILTLVVVNIAPQVSSTRATEAKQQLAHIYSLEKTHFMMNSTYSADLIEIGYEQNKLKAEGGIAYYKIEVIEAGDNGFKVRATSTVDFDKDGQINVWEIDQDQVLKEITKD